MRITINNIKSIDRTKKQLESALSYKYKVNDAKMNIIEDIKTEVDDNGCDEEGDKISDEDRLDEMKVEVDIDINFVSHEIIKTELVEIDVGVNDEADNEIVNISVKKETIDDDDINIKEEPSDDVQGKRGINMPLWNMHFVPHLDKLTRIGRNTDKDKLITFQSAKSNEQKNITEAKRTGKNVTRKTESTDITKLRICGACNKSLRAMKTANDANYTHVIKLNYKPPQRTNSDETSDSCDMCNRAFPRNTQKFYFKCAFCHFETNNKYRLNTHTNARHTKRVRYTCVYCNFKTYVKVKLGSHVNVAHTQCLTCLYCGYVAKFKSYLNKHVCAQHETTKVFSCNFCTYSSKQKGSLDKHFVDVHTEVTSDA